MALNSIYNEECIKDEQQVRIITYYYKEWNNFIMDMHKHNYAEIMYVIKGNCNVDVSETSRWMKNGDLIIIDANIPHRLLVSADDICRMLQISFIFDKKKKDKGMLYIKDLYNDSPSFRNFIQSKSPYTFLKDSDNIYAPLKDLVSELDRNGNDKGLMIQLLANQVLFKIARIWEETGGSTSERSNIYVRKALTFMHSNYDRDIGISEIAAILNIHYGYLYRIFKSAMGKTPLEHLNEIRIEKAKTLLANTDVPIIEISDYIGINGRQYFSLLFKKYTGMTPKQYRNKFRNLHAKILGL